MNAKAHDPVLPGAHFRDRFAIAVSDQHLDPESAARRVLGRPPAWIGRLMGLRNMLVRPFGLKTELAAPLPPHNRIGAFPVISRSTDRLVLGLDDRHLDFRVVVEVRELGDGRQEVSASTLVRTHNLLGRIYLALVTPFHNVIVPAMLAQARRS